IAWDDSGWRKSKKLEPEQLESGKNQNSGGIAIWEAGKPDEHENDGRTQRRGARAAAKAGSLRKSVRTLTSNGRCWS
ncbi:MAG TPA: hypothetical protein VF179_31415, partial [Thermoanaerobaculia bacterium]|nr:hypothetical protein [Thermoanaerobaculia bacterium]